MECSYTGCERRVKAKGLCQMHYVRMWRHGSPDIVLYEGWGRTGCKVEGCDRPHNCKGYCGTHYNRMRLYGDVFSHREIARGQGALHGGPAHAGLPVGTRRTDGQGYLRVRLPGHPHATYAGGWAFEHRVVMSDHLGRPLYDDEIVHHVNGDRTYNRLENLELCVRRQPPGQRAADLLAFAREIIERYDGVL